MSNPSPLLRALLGNAALVLVLAACGSAAMTPSPAASVPPQPSSTPATPGTPGTSPGPTGGALDVTSPAQAAALVIASNERFGRVGPLLPDMVGQSAWYEASAMGDQYSVAITLGSGDCPSGCIDRHTWNFTVARDGTITLVSEEGDEVEAPGGHGTSDPAIVEIRLSAGPVCPVVQDPPDPNCADRAVANAEVVLRAPNGAEVARGVTDVDGLVRFSVPPGIYYAEPAAVPGLMGQAEAVAFGAIGGETNFLRLTYDTGIR